MKSRLASIKNCMLGLSIRKKLMLSHMTMIVVTCAIIGSGSIVVAYGYLRNKVLAMSVQVTYQVLLNVEYGSTEFENTTFSMVTNERFEQVMKNQLLAKQKIDNYFDASMLGTVISSVTISNPDILRIYVVSEGDTFFSWQKGNPKMSVNQITQEESGMIDSLIAAVREEPARKLWKRGSAGTIQFIRQIISADDLTSLGYVICEIEPNHFRVSLPSRTSLVDPANIVVMNQKADRIVLPQNEAILPVVDYALDQAHQGNDLRGTSFQYEGKTYLLAQADARYTKWQVLCIVPLQDLWRDMTAITFYILAAVAFCVVLVGLLAMLISYNITRSIDLLQKNMRLVESGDLSARVKPITYDEIGMLGIHFNHMLEKIHELMQDVADERLMRQSKEYQVLQSQINPHFLYNTLASIRSVAQLNNEAEIESMITCLIEILKASLNKKGEIWLLSEELTYVDYYITLQRYRYEDHFKVVYDITEETEDLYIIGLILQPLVENALYHAFQLDQYGGVITIRSRIEHNKLMLWVRDNGSGMDEQTLQQAIKHSDSRRSGLNGIGIRNVHERIQYSYGEEYGLSITSEMGQGTTVAISLPILREKPL